MLRLLQALFIHLSLSVRKVVGIDLGTSNSVVAAVEAATPAIIPNAEARSILRGVRPIVESKFWRIHCTSCMDKVVHV